jgi:hypothetical protein
MPLQEVTPLENGTLGTGGSYEPVGSYTPVWNLLTQYYYHTTSDAEITIDYDNAVEVPLDDMTTPTVEYCVSPWQLFYIYARLKICVDDQTAVDLDDLSVRVFEDNLYTQVGPLATCSAFLDDCTWCVLDYYDIQNDMVGHNYGVSIIITEDDDDWNTSTLEETWFSTHIYARTPSYDLPPVCLVGPP